MLAPEVRAEINAAPEAIQHVTISKWLKTDHGVSLTAQSVGRHRNRECRCEP
jgi:hypothetical protein